MKITDDLKSTYNSWKQMIASCYTPSHDSWLYIGYYKITVCDQWRGKTGFECFHKDLGKKPDRYLLLRKDKTQNFVLNNVYWGTVHEARRNLAVNRKFEIDGVTKCMIDWAKDYNIPKSTLHYRLSRGMDVKEALKLGKGRSGKWLFT